MKVTKKDSAFGGCTFQSLYSRISLLIKLSEQQRETKFKCAISRFRFNATEVSFSKTMLSKTHLKDKQ